MLARLLWLAVALCVLGAIPEDLAAGAHPGAAPSAGARMVAAPLPSAAVSAP